MKRFATILGLLSLAALMAFAPPRPKTPVVSVTVRAAAGLVWVRWSVTASGGPDSVIVTATSNVAPLSTTRKYVSGSIVDSVSFPRPTFGQSIGGSLAARSWRRGLSAASATKAWGYTEPGDVPPPAPSVDSVKVTPTSAGVVPGDSVHLAMMVWRS